MYRGNQEPRPAPAPHLSSRLRQASLENRQHAQPPRLSRRLKRRHQTARLQRRAQQQNSNLHTQRSDRRRLPKKTHQVIHCHIAVSGRMQRKPHQRVRHPQKKRQRKQPVSSFKENNTPAVHTHDLPCLPQTPPKRHPDPALSMPPAPYPAQRCNPRRFLPSRPALPLALPRSKARSICPAASRPACFPPRTVRR